MSDCCAAKPTVPVTMGSPSFRTMELDELRVTDARFAAGDTLPMHAHERTILAIILEGGFDLRFPARHYECPAGTLFVEPAGERHANNIGSSGARVMVLEIPHGALREDLRAGANMLDAPSARRRGDVLALARQLGRQAGGDTGASPADVEALAWELIGAATDAEPVPGARGAWVESVRDLLHAHLDRPFRVSDLARQVGVHRVHLGRVFRERYGESLGDYHRRIRIEWAAGQLAAGAMTISDVAQRSGFADQAHFTRFFKRVKGMTPVRYTRCVTP
jgi:AraC family transcriptional regulator